MEDEKCGDCKYFEKGECRLMPPQVYGDKTGTGRSYGSAFPEVTYGEWCGQFKNKGIKV